MLWLGLALLTLVAVMTIVVPLVRVRKAAPPQRAVFDRAIYRDQLTELRRDLERGVLDAAQAESARIEIERRLLATEEPGASEPDEAGPVTHPVDGSPPVRSPRPFRPVPFILDAKAALRACDAALVVVDAVSGVEVQTEKAWSYAEEFGIPRLIVVSKMDRERADFEQAVAGITETFGRSAVPIQMPIGREHGFKGVIDLIHMRSYNYDADGSGKATKATCPTN